VRLADIDLSTGGAGDGQADHVIVNGATRDGAARVHTNGGQVNVSGFSADTLIRGSEPTDQLQVNAAHGDGINVDRGVSNLIGVTADLGSAVASSSSR
jgi:hypothetical protein